MIRHDFGKYRPEVGREREIAPLVKLFLLEARPLAVYLAALYVAADHEQRAGVAVIRAAVSVLARHAAELGHRHDHDVVHSVAQVSDERGDRAREIVEALRQLAGRRSL